MTLERSQGSTVWLMTTPMRVFLTGGTGFVGSAVLRELLEAGHQVLALARSDAAAERLVAAGAQIHRGSLEDVASLARAARDADGVIHTAFELDLDLAKFVAAAGVERHALEAIGSAMEGSGRPLLVTSGVLFLAPGRVATEDDTRLPGASPRATETLAASFALRGVHTAVVRLPVVHGADDRNFLPPLIAIARAKGVSAYVGEGLNRCPAVHQRDAARLYRLALEKSAPATRYHAIAEEGVTARHIAEAIGRGLDVPVVSIPPAAAMDHFGLMAALMAADNPASSTRTRERLEWQPREVDLLTDIGHPSTWRSA